MTDELIPDPEFLRAIHAGLAGLPNTVRPTLLATGLVLERDLRGGNEDTPVYVMTEKTPQEVVLIWSGTTVLRDVVAPVFGATFPAEEALKLLDGSCQYVREAFRNVSRGLHDVEVGVAYYDFAQAAGLSVETGRWGPDGDIRLPVRRDELGRRVVNRALEQQRTSTLFALAVMQYSISMMAGKDSWHPDPCWARFVSWVLLQSIDRLPSTSKEALPIPRGKVFTDLYAGMLEALSEAEQRLGVDLRGP